MVLFRELDRYFSEPMVARRALAVAKTAREELGDIYPAAPGERLNRTKQASRPFHPGSEPHGTSRPREEMKTSERHRVIVHENVRTDTSKRTQPVAVDRHKRRYRIWQASVRI